MSLDRASACSRARLRSKPKCHSCRSIGASRHSARSTSFCAAWVFFPIAAEMKLRPLAPLILEDNPQKGVRAIARSGRGLCAGLHAAGQDGWRAMEASGRSRTHSYDFVRPRLSGSRHGGAGGRPLGRMHPTNTSGCCAHRVYGAPRVGSAPYPAIRFAKSQTLSCCRLAE